MSEPSEMDLEIAKALRHRSVVLAVMKVLKGRADPKIVRMWLDAAAERLEDGIL